MRKFLAAAIMTLSTAAFAQTVGDFYIVETTTPGINTGNYTANGMTNSTARVNTALAHFSQLTSNATRTTAQFCTLAILNKTPRITPTGLPAGRHDYNIEYCWPNIASINATSVTWRVRRGNGQIVTGTTDQTVAGANTWVSLGTFDLDPSQGSYIEFDTSTANGGVPASGQRFYIDALRFTLTATDVPVTVSGFTVE